MPLAGYRCPSSAPTAGTINTIDWCLDKCPHQCVAPPLLASMWEIEQTNHHVGTYISASMLSGNDCARKTVLEREKDFWEIPHRRYWGFRGTHAHSIVEHGAAGLIRQLGWLQELRMEVDFVYEDLPAPKFDKAGKFTGKFNKKKPLIITVGGTTDCYNPFKLELWDMKSMKDIKSVMMITGEKPKWITDPPNEWSPQIDDAWVRQLNIYRCLLAKTKVDGYIAEELRLTTEYYPAPEFLGIQGISMMEIPRTGATYGLKQFGKEKTYEIDNVPVLPLEETEQYIRINALQWYKWLVLGEPTQVVPLEKAWLCKSCAFNGERFAEGLCYPTLERSQTLVAQTGV